MNFDKLKNWKSDPSKGEVFTPTPLVHEILDEIPDNIWRNPNSIFLDPCMGKGTFLIEIVRRLTYIYGCTDTEAKSRVFGYDIRVKYINHLKRRGFINVWHKDFLKENIMMKFDVILGNPPYQDEGKPGDNALYQHFTKKILSGLLKPKGIFSFVVPTTMVDYLMNCEKNRTFVEHFYKINFFLFDVPEKMFKKQGVGTTAFVFSLTNEIVTDSNQKIKTTYINSKNELVTQIRTYNKGEIVPKRHIDESEILSDIFLNQNNHFDFRIMVNQKGSSRRIRKKQLKDEVVTLQPTETNLYPIVDKITKTKGIDVYYYKEMMLDFDKMKVVVSKSGYPCATLFTEPTNVSDNLLYVIVDNEIKGQNLVKILNSEPLSKIISSFSTNARDGHRTFSKLKKIELPDYPITENEILQIFQES